MKKYRRRKHETNKCDATTFNFSFSFFIWFRFQYGEFSFYKCHNPKCVEYDVKSNNMELDFNEVKHKKNGRKPIWKRDLLEKIVRDERDKMKEICKGQF